MVRPPQVRQMRWRRSLLRMQRLGLHIRLVGRTRRMGRVRPPARPIPLSRTGSASSNRRAFVLASSAADPVVLVGGRGTSGTKTGAKP